MHVVPQVLNGQGIGTTSGMMASANWLADNGADKGIKVIRCQLVPVHTIKLIQVLYDIRTAVHYQII